MKQTPTCIFSIIVLMSLLLVSTGCHHDDQAVPFSLDESGDVWEVKELRSDRGHDTIVTEDGQMYHDYFYAVELTRNNERVSLLYENSLPESLELEIAGKYFIDGLADAEYSRNWKGYWIHDVRLRVAPID